MCQWHTFRTDRSEYEDTKYGTIRKASFNPNIILCKFHEPSIHNPLTLLGQMDEGLICIFWEIWHFRTVCKWRKTVRVLDCGPVWDRHCIFDGGEMKEFT